MTSRRRADCTLVNTSFVGRNPAAPDVPARRGDRMKPREFTRLGNGASKTNATPQKGPEPLPDSPLLDLSIAAVKTFIRKAKKRGYVSHDQVNALLSSEEVKSEQIEDILAMFSEMGINVVETEEAEQEDGAQREDEEPKAEGELVAVTQKLPAKSEAKGPGERIDD